MKTILIGGGNGLIGKKLSNKLTKRGYAVSILSRNLSRISEFQMYKWDIDENIIDKKAFEKVDIIINLAGENIGVKRWTQSRKQKIIDSRVNSTSLLYKAISEAGTKPEAFISASATGYYGAITSDKIFTETDASAEDFLGKCCATWEKEADIFQNSGIRTVKLRTGVVLSKKDGALEKLARPVKAGFGAALGNGKQYMPWIHIDDLCEIYIKAIEDIEMQGVFNAVAPEHITNKEITHAIANVLQKKIILPNIPALIIRFILGEMSDMVLKGSRVSSAKIEKTGFKFQFPNLQTALKNIYQ
jgi:uncharacterized protein